ncbi:hypothetical protein [Micromonospora chersina]|uniref:hypothetical protein n=1 Tax=Micromonospora chersina TaxID=47854 RepID=UPI0033B89B79
MDATEVQNLIGGVALLITAFGLWREVRSRNRDRRDAEAGPARMVIARIKREEPEDWSLDDSRPTTSAEYKVTVTNYGAAPILELYATVKLRWERSSERADVHGWWTEVLGPGETVTTTSSALWDEPRSREQLRRVDTEISFTDSTGLRWCRVNNERPFREIGVDWDELLSALRHEPRMLWRMVRGRYPFD